MKIFDEMIGVTMSDVSGASVGSEDMKFSGAGKTFSFYHREDCRETVAIDEIHGDPSDLVGSPVLQAEEVSSEGAPDPESSESWTWTFYKFATNKGAVTIKWLGTSNGYYSESVEYKVSDAE